MFQTPHNPDIDPLLVACVQTLNNAEDAVEQGRLVDMTSLSQQIEKLCRAIRHLPVQQAASYKDVLEQLLSDMEKVEMRINLQHEELSTRLKRKEKGVNPLFAQEVDPDTAD